MEGLFENGNEENFMKIRVFRAKRKANEVIFFKEEPYGGI